jgi:hypothetical protein
MKERAAESERRVKAIQQKLDRLDEAYLFGHTIDLTSYTRQRDKLREELTFAKIDYHAEAIEELDVQGILAFAERVLPMRERGLTPGGINMYARTINSYLTWLHEEGHASDRLRVKLLPNPPKPYTTFSDADLRRLVTNAPKGWALNSDTSRRLTPKR